MTYSIVARDPETGALGVAVQSAALAVGTLVPWARPGVGAVATQGFTETSHGPRCLDGLAAGMSAPDTLADAVATDPAAEMRQVAVVSADGTLAARTGALCVDHAGHLIEDGCAVQANMAATDRVWPAMAEAYTAARGPFPHRLLTALRAAEAAGGDARGRMSAALLVVSGTRGEPWQGRLVDLRTDRSTDPLGDLARLLTAADAYRGFDRAVESLYGGDPDGALRTIDTALAALPGEQGLRFLRAGALMARGEAAAATDELHALLADHPGWETVLRGFAAKGLLPLPPGTTADDLLE
ncbi:DUF1028 domain-containing protein [Kitasatospora sp. NPDC007106]|uniref:DUF1028 domain-containing protein n=1 Tax=Kitasatospora sp. NPDC007106 TaxID=3156914 RepID=UPI003405738F